jgi:hypothetical protein
LAGGEVFLIGLEAIILDSFRRSLENTSVERVLMKANWYKVSMGPRLVFSFLKRCSLRSTSGTEAHKK